MGCAACLALENISVPLLWLPHRLSTYHTRCTQGLSTYRKEDTRTRRETQLSAVSTAHDTRRLLPHAQLLGYPAHPCSDTLSRTHTYPHKLPGPRPTTRTSVASAVRATGITCAQLLHGTHCLAVPHAGALDCASMAVTSMAGAPGPMGLCKSLSRLFWGGGDRCLTAHASALRRDRAKGAQGSALRCPPRRTRGRRHVPPTGRSRSAASSLWRCATSAAGGAASVR